MRNKSNLGVFLCTALITTALTMLFTPKSGKQMRDDIKRTAQDTRDHVKENTHNLKQDFKESYLEAAEEVEKERIALSKRQRELSQTIDAIENDLRR